VILDIVFRLIKDQPVTIEVAGEELVGRPPKIEAELAVFEITEGSLHIVLVSLEVPRPLSEGEVIAPSVVMHFHDLKLGPRELV